MLAWEVIPRIPLGDFGVSPHGVGIAIGYFIGATLMARRARRTGFDEDHAWNAAVVGVLGAIVGARIAYIVGHSNQFESPIEYLQIYRGGISLAGGLMGGFLTAWLYARSKKLDFARLADLGAPGLAIGTAVGRIGDLVIGDHLGKPTDGFWGWEYRGGELISSPPCLQGGGPVYPSANGCIEPGMVVHQTALYDAVWALVIFFILMRLDRKPRPKGFLVWAWAALYAAGRIVTDFTRVDKTWFGTGMTGSQLTAIAVLLVALSALPRLRRAPAAAAGAVGEAPGAAGAATVAAASDGTAQAPAADAAEGRAEGAEAEPPGVEEPAPEVAPADEAEATEVEASQEPAVAEEPAGAGVAQADTQEPPVAEETGSAAAEQSQEPPVDDELAGAAETPAAQGAPVPVETPSTGEVATPEPEAPVAPVLVPEAGLDVGEGAAPATEEDRTSAEPVAEDPAVQGEPVAEGETEAPQAPETAPELEPVLEDPESAPAEEVRKDAPQQP